MKPIEFHPEATREAEHAKSYLEPERAGLGVQFADELEQALDRIKTNPERFAIERGRMRRCILTQFSYSIMFAILEDRIWVSAIAHHKRRSNYWRKRKPE